MPCWRELLPTRWESRLISLMKNAAAAGFYRDALSQDEHDENAALHLMHGLLRAGDSESAAALRPKLPTHVLSRCPEMA